MSASAERAGGAPARPERRLFLFAWVLVLALLALVARLAQIQIIQGERFAAAARANQVRRIPSVAPRGRIVDRNGVVLVRSRPSFVCALVPSEVRAIDALLPALAQILDVPEATLRRRLLHHHGVDYKNFDEVATYEPYGPVILAGGLTAAQTARLAEAQASLPGIEIEAQPIRDYPYGRAGSHLFGYVGAISEDEYRARKRRGYTPNDVVGKDGIESVYDDALRGVAGGRQIEVDAQGRVVRELGPIEPVPGNTLVLSIDWRLQQIAERVVQDELAAWGTAHGRALAGAVVALDPYDGGVLALVSYPNFDPNDFADGIKAATYRRYLDDKLQPLYDRAIGAATATGSTFKMVTGSAALSSGVIGKDQVLYDSGSWYCHGTTFTDLAAGGLGSTDFVRALAASSDGYFYQLGDRLGNERLRYYATQFGLGSRLGIDLPAEFAGNWPTNAWSMKVYGVPLEPSDACQLAIGQGAMEATPLQMADVTATVVNGGTLYRPHVVAMIRDPQGRVVRRFDHEVIRHVPVTADSLAEVRQGMSEVTDPGGTAYGLAIPGLPFGGKTGTVETDGGRGPNTTWFVAYAPSAHPTIALAVFMERTGGYGAEVAAPVARRILSEYFHKPIPH